MQPPITKRSNLVIPIVALVLSFATTAGGSWLTLQINAATTRARMDASDKLIEINRSHIEQMVPRDQFVMLKEEMDEVRSDVKEIRRSITGVGRIGAQ